MAAQELAGSCIDTGRWREALRSKIGGRVVWPELPKAFKKLCEGDTVVILSRGD